MTAREARALPQLLPAVAGVIFSGQNLCRAQSQNCETKTLLYSLLMAQCIWCKKVSVKSAPEHIIPACLGCPDGFVLSNGAVCTECNNWLGHLDQALLNQFEIPAFMAGVPRKKGRPPAIRSRGNVIGTVGNLGKEISINMETHPVLAHDGSKLTAFGKSPRNIRATFEQSGQLANISFSLPLDNNPKFMRGIVKIAFSSLAYFLGTDFALTEDFDPIRLYVRNGQGARSILCAKSREDGYKTQVSPPIKSKSGEYIVRLQLAYFEFLVDLSPNLTLFPIIKEKARSLYGETGWSWLS